MIMIKGGWGGGRPTENGLSNYNVTGNTITKTNKIYYETLMYEV
jgi:hypothetical protein